MRISIIAVGRLKPGPERDLCDRYQGRLTALGRSMGLGPLTVAELAESRAAQSTARRDQEAREIIARQDDKSDLILLDERGKTSTSAQFAKWLGDRRDAGTSGLCFAIGGADGHGQSARDAAASTFALGAMTLPHGLARIVLMEQLYRAATILAGHPYHRE